MSGRSTTRSSRSSGGGAGTGKTYACRVVCEVWERLGGVVLPCALAMIEAVRDVIDPRKPNIRHLRRADDGAVETKDGRAMGDPGLYDALERIVRSYDG